MDLQGLICCMFHGWNRHVHFPIITVVSFKVPVRVQLGPGSVTLKEVNLNSHSDINHCGVNALAWREWHVVRIQEFEKCRALSLTNCLSHQTVNVLVLLVGSDIVTLWKGFELYFVAMFPKSHCKFPGFFSFMLSRIPVLCNVLWPPHSEFCKDDNYCICRSSSKAAGSWHSYHHISWYDNYDSRQFLIYTSNSYRAT